ncbi:unnamed protein product [Polarella glacialis]|uniref:Uncharacterized protein n=1 Tax=Polarella glacialis TaxID=89957 RepID=A0A813JDU7_POLGL|nr:unnamed protein product [Polarella glacialis]CAE8694596.1 unnamed protein product [Polarella glacialis]
MHIAPVLDGCSNQDMLSAMGLFQFPNNVRLELVKVCRRTVDQHQSGQRQCKHVSKLINQHAYNIARHLRTLLHFTTEPCEPCTSQAQGARRMSDEGRPRRPSAST